MKFTRLTTEQEVLSLIQFHNSQNEPAVLDLETTGLDPNKDKIVDVVLSGYAEDEAVIFGAEFVSAIPHLEGMLLFHNMSFDLKMLHAAGIRLTNVCRDTMLIVHLLDENAWSEKRASLDYLVQKEFGDNYKEKFWSKYERYEDATEEDRLEYACKDAVYTRRIYNLFVTRLSDSGIPSSLVEHVHNLASALLDTEIRGIAVDREYLDKVGTELQVKIQSLGPAMRNIVPSHCDAWELDEWLKEMDKRKTDKGKAGVDRPEFSFDSPNQLKHLLYERLQLPVQYDAKTRKPTTGDDALAALEDRHPLVPMLRQYRGHQKVYGSYIEGTLERLRNGRIYPEFNINGTKTGRISHSNPNMGQLPSEGGIRGIYIPNPGDCIISADYKQLEVVLAAHFSRDPNLLRIMLEGASQHDITAEGLGIPRPLAKTMNFAMQYGASVRKVMQILGCSEPEAQHALNKYWETYAGLKQLIDECHAKVDRGEPIVNLFGRQRRFPTHFDTPWGRAKAHRQSFNALIQGMGGDLMSEAFYTTHTALVHRQIGFGLFTVHDEGLVSSRKDAWQEAAKVLCENMVGVGKKYKLTVPLAVDCSGPMDRWED